MALDPCDGHKAEGIWNDPCCPHCPAPAPRFHSGAVFKLRPGEIAIQLTPPGVIAWTKEELESKPFPGFLSYEELDRINSAGWACIGCDLEFDITPDHPAPDVHICGVCKTKRPDQFTDAQNLKIWKAMRDNALKVLDTD